MPERRRAGLWVGGIVGVAVVAALAWVLMFGGRHAGKGRSSLVFDAGTPLPVLNEALREGDARAFLILFPRISPQAGTAPKAATVAEAKDLIEILKSVRTGFPLAGSFGRVSSLMMVSKILERLAIEEAPTCWSEAIQPVHDLLARGMADPDLQTRVVALNEVGRLWSWFPGRAMVPVEEDQLFKWKAALYAPVIRRLADREPQARVAAVECLGNLPDDQASSPAIAYLEDRSEGAGPVRKQVLASFARRTALLTDDAILKRLHDPEPGIPEMAELLLTARGLTREQINLGRLIFDPKPEHRASVIPQLRNRTDIDPVVWLLQLSHDASDDVRAGAAAALADRQSPEVQQRLGAMAQSDPSADVRQVAGKFLPPLPMTETTSAAPVPLPRPRKDGGAGISPLKTSGTTVALPPLPGSPNLNPRAN